MPIKSCQFTNRILKLARHSVGIKSLGLAVRKSYMEVIYLVLLLGCGVTIFSTLAYFVEMNDNYSFKHMLEAYWWAIITMTTVRVQTDLVHVIRSNKIVYVTMCVTGGVW